MMVTLRFCTIEPMPYGSCTRFLDGSETSNWPWDNPDYKRLVMDVGHGGDGMSYCREHDLCHAVLAEELFGRCSEVLWRSAHGVLPSEGGDWEEKVVYYFQRYLRGGVRPDDEWLRIGDRVRGLYADMEIRVGH